MVQSARMPDVSMEEILASIRRLIADEETGNRPEAPKPQPEQAASPEKPASAAPATEIEPQWVVSRGPESDNDPRGPQPAAGTAAPPKIVSFPVVSTETEARSDNAAARPVLEPAPPLAEQPAVSGEVRQSQEPARHNDNQLHQSRNKPDVDGVRQERGLLSPSAAAAVKAEFARLADAGSADWDPQLEALARRMLRPMLRAWLDRHLPGLVRRMIREEIERISSGG